MKFKKMLRIAAAVIFVIMFCAFSAPWTAYIINVGNLFGAAVSLILFVITIFWEKFCGAVSHLWERPVGRGTVIISGIVISVGALTALILSIAMINAMNDKPKGRDTTLVVLGCQVKESGPSLMLRKRLNTAYTYLTEHEEVKVVVSGGQGADEVVSEASCMRDYLISKGISEDRIFMEDRSSNTKENIAFSKELIQREGLCSDITIVTDGYHQLRGEIFAKREGLEVYNLSAPTSLWLVPTYWVREWFGILYYTIFK